jgi:hypothetical protein
MHVMNITKISLILALPAILGASAQAQLTVTDQGLTAPSGYETGSLSMNNRFGFDDTEKFGQTFTLPQDITLSSVWVAYNAFVDRTGTFDVEIDAGNDGTVDLLVTNVALDGANFSGATTDGNSGPFYWMEWDFSSYNLALPAGMSSYTILCTGEGPPGAATWLFAPCYDLQGDPYAGGQATGQPANSGPTSDMGFAIMGNSGPGVGYCFGDPGSGAACPCGNDNDGSVPGSGCANGVFVSGAQLTGSGTASLSADTLVLATTGTQPSNSGLYFQANNDLSPGNIWGDGLQCAGGSLKRLGVRFSDVAGYSDTSGWATSISAKVGNITAGDTKYYQCWYRNPMGSPCASDFNASNGYAITWTP